LQLASNTRILATVLQRIPVLAGQPISVKFAAALTAHRGKLLYGATVGTPVHAGSHLRRREMVLDTWLLRNRAELARIFVHEVYHFVWARLGKTRRSIYEELLNREMEFGAMGELGWSAEVLKRSLRPSDREDRTRRWRDYVCESFCDTAAWMYSHARSHQEWTLAESHRKRRAACLAHIIKEGELRV
jgi:hypothetical protein